MTYLNNKYTGLESSFSNFLVAKGERFLDPVVFAEAKQRETDSNPVSEAQRDYDIRMIQLLVAAIKYTQESNPITINNISSSQADVATKLETVGGSAGVTPSRPSLEILSEMFHTFFSSGFNRVCFFGACGMGMYIFWSYMDHKWHMAEVQRRIDSNLVLRTTQWLFDGPVRAQPSAAASKWVPSFW